MKFVFFAVVLIGCSTRSMKLSDKAKELEIFDSKPTGCQVVGKVVGENEIGSKELALNDALNQAAKLGASGLFVTEEVPNGKAINVNATAYECQ